MAHWNSRAVGLREVSLAPRASGVLLSTTELHLPLTALAVSPRSHEEPLPVSILTSVRSPAEKGVRVAALGQAVRVHARSINNADVGRECV
jgi:hypothetical protein